VSQLIFSLMVLLAVMFGFAVMFGVAGKASVRGFFMRAGLILVALLVLPSLLLCWLNSAAGSLAGLSCSAPTLPTVTLPASGAGVPLASLVAWYTILVVGITLIWLVGWFIEGRE